MRTAIYTFGCTQNNYETQQLRELLYANGDIVIEEGEPELIIVNSCAVTASAEKGAEELATRLRKKYPNAIIALAGCYGEVLQRNGARFAHADIVLGNNKRDIIGAVNKLQAARASNATSAFDAPEAPEYTLYKNSALGLLHIQNGCDCDCSYCIVPNLRGKSASRPPERVMDELRHLLTQGYKEVVIAGINIGLYKSGGYKLIDMLAKINAAKGLEGIRLCSLEPMSLDAGFFRGLANLTKLRPCFHISLQSGSDKILALMKRHYTFKQYYEQITELREAVEGAAISTDVITGFPGENGADFAISCENIASCQFSDIHIFKYSPRAGTAAAGLPEQISPHQKNARADILEGIKIQACYNYNSKFIGSVQRVAITKTRSEQLMEGITSHGIKITLTGRPETDGHYVDALVTRLGKGCGSLIGEVK